jgi:protoheme IX farnesyltransferase
MSQAASIDTPADRAAAPGRTADFITLTKPRLNSLVLVTTATAYYLGGGEQLSWWHLLHSMVGTALVAGGASALNQFLERRTDRLMRRTEMRPLPDARLHPQDALWFGVLLSALGFAELSWFVNPLTAGVALLTTASYVLVYTPLKIRTSLSTIVGAVPGALPAVIGWAAATNSLSVEGWVLFAIVFLWQMPHFLAIAWRSTGYQAVLYTAALIPISLLPSVVGLASGYYLVGALSLGAVLLVLSLEFASTRSRPSARRLFFGTILYLPLLWIVLLVDHYLHRV